jgi:hypothetical protein
MRRLVCGLVVVAAALADAGEPAPAVLCDFDAGEPTDGWTTKGLDVAEIETLRGRGLKLAAKDAPREGAFVGLIHRESAVADWRTSSAFSMRVRVEAAAPVEMRLLANARGGGRKLRRFVVEPGDWRDVVLPLKDFRDDSDDRCGTFADVERIVLRWDKGAGEVSIDDLALLPGERGALSCAMTAEDWRRLAFGDAKARVVESANFVLIDDAAALSDEDAKKLVARFEEGLVVLGERFGVAGAVADEVPFLLFAAREEYEAFPPRLGAHFGAVTSPPKASGLSIFGAAMSSFDPEKGWARAVFVHEAMHGAIQRRLGVTNYGNWVQEGLATGVQAQFDPGVFDRAKLADSFAKRGSWTVPWSKLFAKGGAPMSSYPQYASIMDFLADKHRDALPEIWDAVRALREPLHSAAPAAIAKAVGVELAALEEEWAGWGAAYYGTEKK